ncbi:MAG: hypothetical protein ACRC46_01770 [Thermoguttaceae bacterium]
MNAIFSRLTLVVVAVVAATGCRMADPLYDPCSPIMTGQMPADPLCDPLFRLGSAYYRNGAYASGRLDSEYLERGETIVTSDGDANWQSTETEGVKKTSGPRRAVPETPAPTISNPPAPHSNGGMRFRTPKTDTIPSAPSPSPASPIPSPAPWDTPVTPSLPATPLTPPASAHDSGITLEMLRQSDPTITNVEIVEVREGGTRVR